MGHGTNGESQTTTDRVEGLVEILNSALTKADWDVGQRAACQRVRVLWQGPPRFQNGTQDSRVPALIWRGGQERESKRSFCCGLYFRGLGLYILG